MKGLEHEKRHIREYVEGQARGENVTYLEKITTERLFGLKLDAWDVWTDKDRYWVITNPTNLYSQSEYRSLDYTMSFHIGVTHRVMARSRPQVSEEERDRLVSVWRQYDQLADAIDHADESEEFQAIGMRCRECLLDLVDAVCRDDFVLKEPDQPKGSDFVGWAELIAEKISSGPHNERLRRYLKTISTATWELVNWLTHTANAVRLDAQIAVDATGNVLGLFGLALVLYESGVPDRCPSCSSYKLASDYRSDLGRYLTLCESCGWTDQNIRTD